MQELKCKLCGAGLILDESGSWAKCEYCGMKYSLETMQQMIQALNNMELKVSGIATLDSLLSRAETFIKLGETGKAEEIFKQVTEEYPQDYVGWWKLAQIKYVNERLQHRDYLSQSKELKYALSLAPADMKLTICDVQDEWSEHVKKINEVSERYFRSIMSGDYSILENKIWMTRVFGEEVRYAFFSYNGKLYYINNLAFKAALNSITYYNAVELIVDGIEDNILRVHGKHGTSNDNDVYSFLSLAFIVISKKYILMCEYYCGSHPPEYRNCKIENPSQFELERPLNLIPALPTAGNSDLFEVISRAETKVKKYAWAAENRCRYCGGMFNFFNNCKSCGKKRDY